METDGRRHFIELPATNVKIDTCQKNMAGIKIILIINLIFLIFAQPAYAYIDPGTGSYLFQIIAATLLTIIIFFRNIVDYFRDFLKRIFPKKSADD